MAAPISEAILGRSLAPRTSTQFRRDAVELGDIIKDELCPLVRDTAYYFADDGNDSTGLGTQAAPWQTPSKIQEMINAFDGSEGGLCIKLRCDDRWTYDEMFDVTKSHVTIDSYGTGAQPYLDFYTTKIAASGWSQAGATNRYTRTVGAPGDFREQLKPNKAWRRVTSTALVESTQNSYYHDGTTLHAHGANDVGTSVSMNTIATELRLASVTDDCGIDVLAGCTGVRINNIRCDGAGIDGSVGNNQTYAFKSQANGTDVVCFTNLRGSRGPRHVIGHNGGSGESGGFTWVEGCETRLVTEQEGSPFVFYIGGGGQEEWIVGNATPQGSLPCGPNSATRTFADGLAVLAHANPGEEVGFICVIDHYTPQTPDGFGCHKGVQIDDAPVVTNRDDACVVIINERLEKASGVGLNGHTNADAQNIAGHALWMAGTLSINPRLEFYPLNSSFYDSFGNYDPDGWIVGGGISVDLRNPGMTESWLAFFNASGAHKFRSDGVHFDIWSNDSTDFAPSYDANFTGAVEATIALSTGSEMVNCTFAVHRINPANTAAIIRPAMRNEGTYQRNNAYYGVSENGSDLVGVSNATNSVTLSSPPAFLVPPGSSSPLVGMGEPSISYDFFGQPRSAVAPTIGPIEFVPATSIATTQAEANAALLEAIQAYVSPDNRDLAPVDHLWQLKRSGDGTLRSTNPLYVHAGDVRRVGFNCDITSLLPSGATLHSTGTPTTANTDLTLDATGIDPKVAKLTIEVADDATVSEEADDGSVTGSWVKLTITNSNGTGPIAVYGEVIIQEEP